MPTECICMSMILLPKVATTITRLRGCIKRRTILLANLMGSDLPEASFLANVTLDAKATPSTAQDMS